MNGFGELGSTTDPHALVGGSAGTIRADADDLRTRAGELESEAEGPVSATVPSWTGGAATASTQSRTALAEALNSVGDVFRLVADVLDAHAEVLTWGQQRAQVAIDLWAQGMDEAHAAGVFMVATQPRPTGLLGSPQPSFLEADPGAAARRAAQDVLAVARGEVRASQAAAARLLDELCADMPDGQFDFGEFLGGIGDWVAGIGNLVWRFNAIRAVVDPEGMFEDGREMGAGLWDTAAYVTANPTEAGSVLFNTQLLQDNPGRWWGQMFPDLALTAVGGVGVLSKTGTLAHIGDNLADLGQRARGLNWADDTGGISLDAWLRRDPIDLADGTQLVAASAEEQAAAAARIADLPQGPVLAQGVPAAFQESVYGPSERLVALSDTSVASVDGITSAYGSVVGDAKFVAHPNRSIYIPETVSPSFAPIATEQMDTALVRLATVSEAFEAGRPVEIVTNSLASANAWEARMRALGISGYVRLQP